MLAKLRKKSEQAKNANLILLFPVDKVILARKPWRAATHIAALVIVIFELTALSS